MKRKRFTEEQIIAILKEHEAGSSAKDLARRHSVAENLIYRLKASSEAWRSPRPSGCASWRPRTAS